MFAKESKRVRHFVGRCERGEDVHAALRGFATEHAVHSGWVRAIGAFEAVELREYDQAAQAYKAPVRFGAQLEVLSLSGNISSRDDQPFVHLHATLSRETDNGIEVLGGHLERARVFALEFYVEAFDDAALVRERDAATGLDLFVSSTRGRTENHAAPRSAELAMPASQPVVERVRERERSPAMAMDRAPQRPAPASAASDEPAPRAAPKPAGVTWAMAASASEEAQLAPARSQRALSPVRPLSEPKVAAHRPPAQDPAANDPRAMLFDEPIPEVGEYLDHRQFGLCKIERMEDDGGVMLRMPDKRRKLIKLDVLQVLEPRIEGDKIIYPVRPRGPRKA